MLRWGSNRDTNTSAEFFEADAINVGYLAIC